MVQIAIISDIHANLPALQEVIKDIEARQIEQIYCLGDLVDFAPWPNEVIQFFRNTRIPCLLGNHDERIAFDQAIYPLAHHDAAETRNRIQAITYSKRTITVENKRWLSQLPYQLELILQVEGRIHRLLLVHASPNRNDEYIYESHPEADLLSRLAGRKVDVLLMGHTHVSYIKKSSMLLINCGSVGRSKEADRKASYCLLTLTGAAISAEIIKVSYPIEAVALAIYQSDIPNFYADFLLKRSSEAPSIAARL
ncbi:metallophosphoesterase family protein [Spirosoma panaciterrae]|uniref:metallophosphoesterase family protein n=1 Tax=Spirosoma panaciterrae TaxID=496058 RepID=UPI000375D308|nr:metallophosphoesterase family protein [Spirosoma panaciterrae]